MNGLSAESKGELGERLGEYGRLLKGLSDLALVPRVMLHRPAMIRRSSDEEIACLKTLLAQKDSMIAEIQRSELHLKELYEKQVLQN